MQNKYYYFLLSFFCSFNTTTQTNNTQFLTDLVKKDSNHNASQEPLQIELTLFKEPNFFYTKPEIQLTISNQIIVQEYTFIHADIFTKKTPDQPTNLIKIIGAINMPPFTNYNFRPYRATEIGYDLFILCRPCTVCSRHLLH